MYVSVSVNQLDPKTLQWMQNRWGGALRLMAPRKGGPGRRAWEWCVVGQQAYRLLEGLLPTLKTKEAQARNALRLRDLRKARGQGKALTPDEVALQAEIRKKALQLNRRDRVWLELPT